MTTSKTMTKDVSIHAPRVGCDLNSGLDHTRYDKFQFTHPVWGATINLLQHGLNLISFNSRTPCGVRHTSHKGMNDYQQVSIHAPRVGCDQVRGRVGREAQVSIHAPRVGCDEYFGLATANGDKFQFTHPVWGATSSLLMLVRTQGGFNSRTPCGVRRLYRLCRPAYQCFNSRTPCGVRPKGEKGDQGDKGVSIHAPRVGCDHRACGTYSPSAVSIHAPRVGCDRPVVDGIVARDAFQFTHPVWGATLDSLIYTERV